MKIRRAVPEDCDEIKKLLLLLCNYELKFDEPFLDINLPNTKAGEKYIIKMIKNPKWHTLVAEKEKSKLCGVASICLKKSDFGRKNMKPAELVCIYIEEEFRRKGLATKLLEELCFWAKANGANRLLIGVSFENYSGRKFYERIGLKSQSIYLEKNL